jgi:hypothetical protein
MEKTIMKRNTDIIRHIVDTLLFNFLCNREPAIGLNSFTGKGGSATPFTEKEKLTKIKEYTDALEIAFPIIERYTSVDRHWLTVEEFLLLDKKPRRVYIAPYVTEILLDNFFEIDIDPIAREFDKCEFNGRDFIGVERVFSSVKPLTFVLKKPAFVMVKGCIPPPPYL